jgi:hypothetical protein
MADIPVIYYNKTAIEQSGNPRWWKEKPADIFKHIFGYLRNIEQNQAGRRLQWLQFARLYQNQNPMGFFNGVNTSTISAVGLKDSPAVNVVKSCIDTATSKIGKSRPRPLFLTDDGNYKQQTRAKKLTQFMDGLFDSIGLYSKAASVFRDGGIFGTGALKFYIDADKGMVNCEKVLCDELLVDDGEAIYGQPRQMHQRKYVSRDVLLEQFPKHKDAILAAPLAFTTLPGQTTTPDLVKIYESWHLPSGKNAGDGYHAISIETATLFHEPYAKDYFPFVFWSWTPRVAGFWGMGLAEELFGTQLEINKLLRNIQLAQHLVAVPRVWIANGSVVSASHINNEIGSVVKYTGTEPKFYTPSAMSSEIYEHLRWLIASAYESTGISQLSATSQKPAGLESAVALREYQDIESERFQVVGQRWEEFFLKCAEICVDMTADMYQNQDIETKVKVAGKGFMDSVKWSDVDMEKDKYILRCFAANILPTQPAGRLQKVQELVQAGWLSMEEGRKLVDFPDIESTMNKELSSTDLTNKMIDSILDDGIWMSPEPEMDLEEARVTAQKRIIEARLHNVEDSKIDMLTRWAEVVKSMLPAPPVDATGMMAPQATPETRPQSDLLPYAPQ